MNRNVESHFGHIATKDIRRSKFKRDCSLKTTMNTGKIYPIYVDEVLPGDTAKIHVDSLVRMTTPIYPVMDNAWMDTYFFFVPRRLVWEHWREFMGENTTDAWTQETEYQIPQLKAPEGGWNTKSLAAYLGARAGVENISIDACYTRAYTLIYNEWFRNQNLSEPAELSLSDSDTAGSNGTDEVVDMQKGGCFATAVKYADYFTRALPEPQKGPDIYIPIGSTAPVFAGEEREINKNAKPLKFDFWDSANEKWLEHWDTEANNKYVNIETNTYGGKADAMVNNANNPGVTPYVTPNNLIADLQNAAGATINQLRQAFAVQRMYELDARGGTRYIEILATHFGVNSPDGRQQRPEYLGGKRIPINITQVVQQSSTDATTPQGNTAAMSLTIDNHDCFTKSFTEHGIILGLAVIRTEHTYQQGIPRILSRKNRTDFYWPALANIGETYIKNKEIYAQGTSEDEEAFGYQEAWAEYRYGINRVTGELNSDYTTPLDSWTYADKYTQLPTLGNDWVKETDQNVARTLAIQTQDQFIADFYFDQTWIRPMPIYSIPSLTGWN